MNIFLYIKRQKRNLVIGNAKKVYFIMNTEHSQIKKNYLKVGSDPEYRTLTWDEEDKKFKTGQKEEKKLTILKLRKEIEPWLTALFQSERLNLLVGSGLTTSQEILATGKSPTKFMECINFDVFSSQIEKAGMKKAKKEGRKEPNIEDQINIANTLLEGLNVYVEKDNGIEALKEDIEKLKENINKNLKDFIKKVLDVEKTILDKKNKTIEYLIPFLMSFASRSSSRERLHIFTTNYDRVIEWGADLTGLRLIDRFVGNIEPVFRASRLNIDMHYNPPGIRGEPRYLEGVAYFTKLHGSLDWSYKDKTIKKIALPFGQNECKLSSEEQCLIYPNSAKDQQTANYPYSELFRDFATAVCRPNTTLVTYGYGFGDEHINRIIEDMLTVPSTHLVIISYDINPKICSYFKDQTRKDQISILIGPQLANIEQLVKYYLPKSAIDKSMDRLFENKKKRGQLNSESSLNTKKVSEENDNTY